MNVRSRNAEPQQAAIACAPRLSATTRAIRSALAVSATMLALAGSGAAAAGTCSVTDVDTISCDGVFNSTITYPDVDLTLIVGANAPTSVTPAAGTAGIDASWPGVSTVISYADISTDGADGIHQYGSETATLSNYGSIETSVTAAGANAIDVSAYGDVTVVNGGSVDAYGSGYDVYALTAVSYTGNTSVTNLAGGSISASAYDGIAAGLYAVSNGVTDIYNYGDISADSSNFLGDAAAYGSVANGTSHGIALTVNSGDISATAYSYAGNAHAIAAISYGAAATMINYGSIEASAEAPYGEASATGAEAYGVYTAVYNYGEVGATAEAAFGTATATGAYAGGYYGAIIYNGGDISATASAYAGTATAVGAKAYALVFAATVSNDGSISATATAGDGAAFATGVSAAAYFNSTTTNDGDISAVASIVSDAGYGAVEAIGVYNLAFVYDASVVNNGSISATASAGGTYDSYTGNCVGDCNQVSAIGVFAQGIVSYYASSSLENGSDGEISASASVSVGYASAYGALVEAGFGGYAFDNTAYVSNDGSITASASGEYAFIKATGVQAVSVYGDAIVVNHGDISATTTLDGVGFTYAVGAKATQLYGPKYGTQIAQISNYGDISAVSSIDRGYSNAYGAFATGKYSSISNAEGAEISASATADTWGLAYANGVHSYGKYGSEVVNHGTIDAFASAHGTTYIYTYVALAGATAVDQVTGLGGDTSFINDGDVIATAISYDADSFFAGGAGATGVHQDSKYDAIVANEGSIAATAHSDVGLAAADGIFQLSSNNGYISNYAGATITAVADSATLDGDVDGYGGRAIVDGTRMGGFSLHQYNGGEIVASAYVAPGSVAGVNPALAIAYGTYMHGRSTYPSDPADLADFVNVAELNNVGSIEAYAGADQGEASAYGAFVWSSFYSHTTNSGHIVAVADADEGAAFALGTYNYSLVSEYLGCDYTGCHYAVRAGDSALDNASGGAIIATASADGGLAEAYGAVVIAAYGANITNAGSISAHASADGGLASATGSLVNSFYGLPELDNSGSIYAGASGDVAEATGAYVLGSYGVVVVNDAGGQIIAAAFGPDAVATAVSMDSDGFNVLTNAGKVAALGDGLRIAVASSANSVAAIYNTGTITGSIQTGVHGDYLYNDGIWNAIQASYFGAGDDSIVNADGGNIHMTDAAIDLGTYSYYGNSFYNNGTITLSGDNLIDMGGPIALVPSANPYAFYNYGVLDFQDGAPNDSLTIVGDFAGDGDIDVDVSGLNGTSDLLYIDGSVVSGSVNTINVDLLDVPDTADSQVGIVYVSGDSVAGNFVLGAVNWAEDDSFLTLDFDLVADIDASNATPDSFSLGIAVTGLSDPGTIAASVSPSVMSLMNSQTGTWRQRTGVIDGLTKGAVALWARVFTDKGSFSPEHDADNFGNGGNFNFDQKNSGAEAGIDFSVTDEFSLGLLVSQSKADTHLDNPGSGSAEIDADTWGVYGTWISPNGFYLDASYRWMSFDVDLKSVAGAMESSGDAESFNVELGYAWTLAGGLKIEPQLQYTHTNVDNVDVVSSATGMSFRNDGGDSSRGRLGVALRKSFGDADSGWMWTPYATLSAVREFDGKSSYVINNAFSGSTSVEGTSALLELGVTARHQNWSVFGGLNWQDGGAVNSFFGGQLGVRYTFGGAAPAPAPAPVALPPAKTCADLDDDGDGVTNCDDKCLGSTAGQAVGADGCPVPVAPEPEPTPEPKPFRG